MKDRNLRELQAEIERLKARLKEVESRRPGWLRGLVARVGSSPRVRIALMTAIAGLAAVSYAATISVPYEFVNGETADADEVNANFSTLEAESNSQDSRITTVENDLGAHQGDASAHHSKTTDASELTSGVLPNARLAPEVDTDAADDLTDGSPSGGDLSGTYPNPQVIDDSHTHDGRYYTESEVDALLAPLSARIAALEALLVGVSRGGTPDTLTFSGMNVQVVDGTGDTDGAVNGLGNLIVGYNENNVAAIRTGSHNLVVGYDQGYRSYAGLVAGTRNTIWGPNSSVSGGASNYAGNVCSGGSNPGARCVDHDECTGGGFCLGGQGQSVSGGAGNSATSGYSSVAGGQLNTASGNWSSVSGGYSNTASGNVASVSGGQNNTASGSRSSVSGGWNNTASGSVASISAGQNNTASGLGSSVAGGGGDVAAEGNTAFGDYSAILGGRSNLTGDPAQVNHAIGEASTVSGGSDGEASGDRSSVSGGYNNTASGEYSSVSGGAQNWAGNWCFGGTNPQAQCRDDGDCIGGGACGTNTGQSVSGGENNTASGSRSSISGGESNKAGLDYASVSGGANNSAGAINASVSGGNGVVAPNTNDWASTAVFGDSSTSQLRTPTLVITGP